MKLLKKKTIDEILKENLEVYEKADEIERKTLANSRLKYLPSDVTILQLRLRAHLAIYKKDFAEALKIFFYSIDMLTCDKAFYKMDVSEQMTLSYLFRQKLNVI